MISPADTLAARRVNLARRILDAEALIIELREELAAVDLSMAQAQPITILRPVPVAFPAEAGR